VHALWGVGHRDISPPPLTARSGRGREMLFFPEKRRKRTFPSYVTWSSRACRPLSFRIRIFSYGFFFFRNKCIPLRPQHLGAPLLLQRAASLSSQLHPQCIAWWPSFRPIASIKPSTTSFSSFRCSARVFLFFCGIGKSLGLSLL